MRSLWVLSITLVAMSCGCSEPAVDALEHTAAVQPAAVELIEDATGLGRVASMPGDWPIWRGQRGNGISLETAWSADWPAVGPPVRWTAAIGTGFSSVTVADGRLYSMGFIKGGDASSDGDRDADDAAGGAEEGTDADDDLGEEAVVCLNALTGEEIWRHVYPGKLVANLHEGGPASTPTIDGERIYTIGREGQMFCLDAATGDVHWSKRLQDELGVKMPEWGFSCSPLIIGSKVVVEAGRTAAFDKQTGELLWQTDLFLPGYGSPVTFFSGDEQRISVLNNEALLVVRADDGTLVDQFPWKTQYRTTSTTPIVFEDTLFVSTGYKEGCALFRLADDKLDVVYDNKQMSNHMNNCVLWQGHLYGFDGNSHVPRTVALRCMDHATGEILWTEHGMGCGSLMMADGKLIVLSDQGKLLIAPASPEGFSPIAEADVLDGRCWTVPVLAQGNIYCRDAAGNLVCVDVSE